MHRVPRGEFARDSRVLAGTAQCDLPVLWRAAVRGRDRFSGDGDWCSEAKVYVYALFDGTQPIRSAAVGAGHFGNAAAAADGFPSQA